ncbi:DUF1566 domain-containing protein [Desulfococcaceae bacterium HSG8]|nr:DUF1566 domain-containing protein [Desulfococcaceae bacterium HSG8]
MDKARFEAAHAPFEAYQGDEPYIFISYAHKDVAEVYLEITRLHEIGYRIWYDEGIAPGSDWPDDIAKALAECNYFMVFISPNAVASRNVRNEINFALNRDKPLLAVYLEQTTLPLGLELRMGDLQAVMKYRMSEYGYYRKLEGTIPRLLMSADKEGKMKKEADLAESVQLKNKPSAPRPHQAEDIIAFKKTSHSKTLPSSLPEEKTTKPKENLPKFIETTKKPRYQLRSKPATISERKSLNVVNEFENNGDGTITDHATWLMWQKSGADYSVTYEKARAYILGLNDKKFAGHSDWRLPTIEELMSLLESEKQSGDLFIDPMFDKKQLWCWSSDKKSPGSAWDVYFNSGFVGWVSLDSLYYVRGVRSIQWVEIKDQDRVMKEEIKYRLTVNAESSEARVRILNIQSPYKPGMALEPGIYQIEVSEKGYETYKERKEITDSDLTLQVILKKKVSEKPAYRLRIKPIEVSPDEFKKVFRLDDNWRPQKYIDNDFKDNGDGTVADDATGLIWEKSGVHDPVTYEKARAYIQGLNDKKFVGHSDWRLPTTEELMSLLESEKQSNDLYIDTIFDKKQLWCWSSDKRSSVAAWEVYFSDGAVFWNPLNPRSYARGVRSRQY